jgi:hypothetical protein
MQMIAVVAAAGLVLLLGVSARPGHNVEVNQVIEEKIGRKNSGWCELHQLQTGWVQTSFNLGACRHVNGTGYPLTDSDAAALASALAKSDEVSVLTLSSAQLSSAGVQAVVRKVSTHGSLVGLILDNNRIDSTAAPALSELLRLSTKLAVLDLSNNNLGVDGECR